MMKNECITEANSFTFLKLIIRPDLYATFRADVPITTFKHEIDNTGKQKKQAQNKSNNTASTSYLLRRTDVTTIRIRADNIFRHNYLHILYIYGQKIQSRSNISLKIRVFVLSVKDISKLVNIFFIGLNL